MSWYRDPRRGYSTLDGSDLQDSAGIYRISEGGAEVAPNASRRMMNSEVVHTEGQDVTKYRRRPTGAGGGEM